MSIRDAFEHLTSEIVRTSGLADFDKAVSDATRKLHEEILGGVEALEARIVAIEEKLGIVPPVKAQPAVADNTGSSASPVAPEATPASDSAASPSAAEGAATSTTA